MSKNVKAENVAAGIGSVAGAGAGIVGTGALVSGLGTGAGGAVVTTGLATLGGSLLGGLTAVAAIPVITAVGVGAVAYGITKAIKNE